MQALQFYIYVERYENGARPMLEVTFRQDRPQEIGFRVFSAPGSAKMGSCILTATMGNYARLRHLWLKDKVVEAKPLFGKYKPNHLGFAPYERFDLESLITKEDDVIVPAMSNEDKPANVMVDPVPSVLEGVMPDSWAIRRI